MASFLYTKVEAHELLKQLAERYIFHPQNSKYKLPPSHIAILEVGAGSGNLLRELATTYDVMGCGTDPFITRREEGRIKFLPLKAEEIETLPRRYDLIYSVHSLHHFSDPKKFLEACNKKLTWEGKVIIVDWNRGAKTGVFEHYYDIQTVEEWAKLSGLTPIESGTNGQNFFTIFQLTERRVAVASKDGKRIFRGMFGQSPYFFIYAHTTHTSEIANRGSRIKLKRMVKNRYSKTLQHLKTYDVYNEVAECQAIIAKSIGKKGQQRLRELGVRLILNPPEEIEEALKLLY